MNRRACHAVKALATAISAIALASSARAFGIKEFLERAEISDVALTQDGSRVLYTVTRADLNRNARDSSLWVQSINDAKAVQLPIQSGTAFEWLPDSNAFLYATGQGAVHRWDIQGASDRTVLPEVELLKLFPTAQSVAIQEMRVSPSGALAALVVTATDKLDQHPLTGVEIHPGWSLLPNVSLPSVLQASKTTTVVELDLASGEISRLVPEGLEVTTIYRHAIDWAPDSKEVVFSASAIVPHGADTNFMSSDLYLVDLLKRKPRLLVSQPGYDIQPSWSPDGTKIAFKTLGGKIDWKYNSQIGLVDLKGKEPRRWLPTAAMSADPRARSIYMGGWAHNSAEFYYVAPVRGFYKMIAVNAETGVLREVETRAGFDVGGSSDGAPVSARNADVVVVPMSDFNHIPDLFVWRNESGTMEQITNLDADVNEHPFAQVESIEWPSSDKKWQLQGFLLTPISAKKARALPLIVYVAGGPTMVDSLDIVHPGLTSFPGPELLNRGYAIFIPNTRGRNGFGESFTNAFDVDHSMNRIPSTDVISGVEYLIQQGRVDPKRIGIAAHSYGGGVAAYALTETHLFRAASIHEAVFLNPSDRHSAAPNAIAWAHIYGGSSPFDPRIWPLLSKDSPTERVELIKTPTLLEFGVESEAQAQGRPFFEALQLNHVPSEFIVYPRSGHNTAEPVLIADGYRRNLEWFDYWLKGIASDRMLERYGPPN